MVLQTPPLEPVESIIPLADDDLTRKDYASDVDTRWCPGCGDYSILAQMQRGLSNLNVAPEKMVFVSGIGCSSRFPYYMNTYGMHSIHGRAPTIASGLKLSRPDLMVFVITGDGDALSIGGNHLLHVLRRNVDVKIFLFNNRIYGLTKGQYSPTSELGKVTKSSPIGTTERPLNPLSVALASEATFVARSFDTDPQHLTETIERAARHHGAAFVEILQNCNISSMTARSPTTPTAMCATSACSTSSTASRCCLVRTRTRDSLFQRPVCGWSMLTAPTPD